MLKSFWRSLTGALSAFFALWVVDREVVRETPKPPLWKRCQWCARPINKRKRHVCGESLPLEGN